MLVSVCVVGSWGSLGWLAGAWNPLVVVHRDRPERVGGRQLAVAPGPASVRVWTLRGTYNISATTDRRPMSHDQRDLVFAAARVITLQPSCDLRPGGPPVYDQGQLGSCTASRSWEGTHLQGSVADAALDVAPAGGARSPRISGPEQGESSARPAIGRPGVLIARCTPRVRELALVLSMR